MDCVTFHLQKLPLGHRLPAVERRKVFPLPSTSRVWVSNNRRVRVKTSSTNSENGDSIGYCFEPKHATPGAAEHDMVTSQPRESVKYYVSGENAVEATEMLLKQDAPTILPDPLPVSTDGNTFETLRQIFVFAGPALGIWLSGPIMSMIDTSVVGMTSSVQLAALGPGTVMCDGIGYVFMFLSVATSNLIATALADKDETEAANHLARLLFVALASGVFMFAFTKLTSKTLLRAFVRGNEGLLQAAASYVDIRAVAWPIFLVTMVAQSASLGMQDSWTPLKVLAVASVINIVGDLLLCSVYSYGIAGAAWATTLAQYVGGLLMLQSLKKKGYNPLAIAVPRMAEFVQMINIAAPVLLTMLSKVSFYTMIIFVATSLGEVTLAAHQVMVGIYTLFSICGEPLAQTAQSFMPELIAGKTPNLKQARALLQTLLVSGACLGLGLGVIGLVPPLLVPHMFTNDSAIVKKMHSVLVPYFMSIALTPPTLALEGVLLSGRDLTFLGTTMTTSFIAGSIFMVMLQRIGFGLNSCWWMLVLFHAVRLSVSYWRLNSAKSVVKRAA